MKKGKMKCLYRNIPPGFHKAKIVIKDGYVEEYVCDCRMIPVGFYKAKFEDGVTGWIAVDIESGLALITERKTLKQCEEDLKVLLMNKGYKTIRNMRKKAFIKYKDIYESKEWNNEAGNQ